MWIFILKKLAYYYLIGYNIYSSGGFMQVIETTKFKNSYKRLIIRKHLMDEDEILNAIIDLLLDSNNLDEIMKSKYKIIYHIEKKKGNLKEYYTARLNKKMRLIMKPNSDYPYNEIEIDEIIMEDIDNSHYGDG